MLYVLVPGSSKYRPLNLRPRGFRVCETMWFILGKNSRNSIKNQVTQTDSALNTDQILAKNYGNLMLPDRVIAAQNADIRRHKYFS